ncbi:MAG: tRNA methyl transferase PRC-barrel domain-containing protein, partial [candidate division WOR-3 bacterium]|nr:tRNA methyl transferase PRC-barrel domain-containing protein [candidate division WOR-3 bacterium]
GEIVDLEGNVLGTHKGIWFHTIGQRKGLGIASGEPLYVITVNVKNNRVVVGPRSALSGSSFRLSHLNRFTDRDLSNLSLTCKIRYATPQISCRLEDEKVILDHPVQAITPGQLGVIYWENKVVMAGIIEG